MSDVSGGGLNFASTEEFVLWLEAQPRATQIVITTRAALRVAPALLPIKAHDYGMASSINAIYATFLKGKDLAQAVKGWDEIAQKLGEHAEPVIEFLKHFRPGG